MNCPSSAAGMSPGGHEFAAGGELLDAVVRGVDHVHVPRRVRREPADRPELAVPAAVGAPLAEIGAGGAELLHDIAELVGDVHVAGGVQRDGLGKAQDRFGALADDRRGGVRARGGLAGAGAGFGAGGRGQGRAAREGEHERGHEQREQGTTAPGRMRHRRVTTRDRRRRSGAE